MGSPLGLKLTEEVATVTGCVPMIPRYNSCMLSTHCGPPSLNISQTLEATVKLHQERCSKLSWTSELLGDKAAAATVGLNGSTTPVPLAPLHSSFNVSAEEADETFSDLPLDLTSWLCVCQWRPGTVRASTLTFK